MYSTTRISIVTLALLTTATAPVLGEAVNEDLKITANDAGPENEFGYSVAIDEGVIAVGARRDTDNGPNSGSAYLFHASTGAQLAKLLPADGAAGDEFGFSIAINGGIVAVGALRDDHDGVTSGSAYLFDATTGAQLAKLTPDDGAAGDEFGFSIAIDGGVVAVGAKRDDDNGTDSGSVYLFNASTGGQIDKLVADDGEANDNFGESVAMDSGVLATGAHGDWDNGPLSGSAYLFDVATGAQIAKLLPDNGASNNFFGTAIDIDNGLVVVGAWARSIFFDHSGAAYVFDISTGSQLAYIFPSDGHDRDNFGISVSIDNGVVAIGSHQDDDNGFNSGSAYLFDAFTGTQIDKLLASDGATFDLFGSAIAIDNGLVVVGAIGDEDNGPDAGSVYVFGAGTPLPGDLDGDGDVDQADLGLLLSCYGVSDCGDLDGDGDTDQADLGQLLANYGT